MFQGETIWITGIRHFVHLHRHGRLIRRQKRTVRHLSIEIGVENQEIEIPSLKLTAKAPEKWMLGRLSILSFLGPRWPIFRTKWLLVLGEDTIDFACGSSFWHLCGLIGLGAGSPNLVPLHGGYGIPASHWCRRKASKKTWKKLTFTKLQCPCPTSLFNIIQTTPRGCKNRLTTELTWPQSSPGAQEAIKAMQHQILEAVVELLHVLQKTQELDQIRPSIQQPKKFGNRMGW